MKTKPPSKFNRYKTPPTGEETLGQLLRGIREGTFARKYESYLEDFGFQRVVVNEDWLLDKTDIDMEARYQLQRTIIHAPFRKIKSGTCLDFIFVYYVSHRAVLYFRVSAKKYQPESES